MAARVTVLLSLALWLSACHHDEHEPEERPRYPVTTPLVSSIELTSTYVAQVRAIQHIELRALEHGYLQGIFVDEGQLVQRGQRMFQIMPLLYQAELLKAQAESDKSLIELNNTKALADKNVVSPNELALAKASYAGAQANLQLAVTHKGLTELRAPFTGIMGRFHARQGSLIDEGDLLTTLSDNTTVWVYFNVAEAEYLQIKRAHPDLDKAPVRLMLADGQLFDQPGKIETIEADFDNETGTIAFRAAFPNPKGLLRHGETGKVVMTSPLENATLIPQQATFEVLEKRYVFTVDAQGIVHSKPITIKAELPQIFVVEAGLAPTERVLLEGLRKVRDGDHIEVEVRDPKDVLPHLQVAAE